MFSSLLNLVDYSDFEEASSCDLSDHVCTCVDGFLVADFEPVFVLA